MTASSADGLNRAEAITERARLQQLLDAYEAGREAHQEATKCAGSTLEIDLDRAGKVRGRIARLDEIIGP
jgi:hypothetical protein